ncbi:hypothetical protein K490DRAFT_72620 [Saccharata proteae CBS 121410]|uniref:Protein with SprT-like domain at the N terminus n=1 Tax=Saccharata proteae CBS 121410 TaxID=1314787 RepID=A0A6A5YBW3_9PEZI|nr:hypothetical protein K490DRAFT_72620 [Saccharata proteae CBS 121410]
MPLTDQEAAHQAIASFDALSEEQLAAQTVIIRLLHSDDASPFVDVHELFRLFDVLYFKQLLMERVEVSWSERMTLCAGICELTKDPSGAYRRIRLKLSEPLLKFRPRSDTINTLLHESIHAYFFVTSSWRHSRDDLDPNADSGHGTGFQLLASAINAHGSYDVSIFHAFHDEVDSYRTHVWQCDGPCRSRAPFFGLVKRSMNRAPGKSDSWWQKHEDECGGRYAKIAEPKMSKERMGRLSVRERAGLQKNKIDGWVGKGVEVAKAMGGEKVVRDVVEVVDDDGATTKSKRKHSVVDDGDDDSTKKSMLACPICDAPVTEKDINSHLDTQHPP